MSTAPAIPLADTAPVVPESERAAVEAALLTRFGAEQALVYGSWSASPYAAVDYVYGPPECATLGTRVALVAVCRSHNGAGGYKGRGRWRTVYAVAAAADGARAVCGATDRDALEVGASGYYTRPWATEEAENASKGIGLGAQALSDALAALGL